MTYFFLIGILLSVVAATASAQSLHWSFDADPAGGLPKGWAPRGGSARGIYQIEVDRDGNRYLAARSRGSDVQLGVEVAAKPQQQPILSWRWRVWELPRRADERKLATLDSAASVYVVFGSRLFPKIIKYVWSSTVPAGSVLRHPRSDRLVIVVIASGEAELGQWQAVTRNILADGKKFFGSDPGSILAIGVKTDSDSTSSSARADYDDVRLGPPSPPAAKGNP
jgi:hypothetical protein